MKLPAASMTPFGLPQNASATEIIMAAANQARAGDPLQGSRNTPSEYLPNPMKSAESSLTFGYGEH